MKLKLLWMLAKCYNSSVSWYNILTNYNHIDNTASYMDESKIRISPKESTFCIWPIHFQKEHELYNIAIYSLLPSSASSWSEESPSFLSCFTKLILPSVLSLHNESVSSSSVSSPLLSMYTYLVWVNIMCSNYLSIIQTRVIKRKR